MPTASDAAAPLARPERRERVRNWAPMLAAALLGLSVGDSIKPPPEQIGARMAIGIIDIYRATLSPALQRTGLIRCASIPPVPPTARKRSCVTACRGRFAAPNGCNPYAREERIRSVTRNFLHGQHPAGDGSALPLSDEGV
jgi:hypothetical protein